MRPWLEQIKNALSSREPLSIEQIAQGCQWVSLPASEREQLAQELSQEAVRRFDQAEQQADRLFDLATSIAPVSAKIFLLHGIAFYQRATSLKQAHWLERAIDRFHKAAEYAVQPGMEHIWLLKSYLLAYDLDPAQQGVLEKARTLWLSLPIQAHDSSYQTQRLAVGGQLWRQLAESSGEPCDYQQAVELLQMALEQLPASGELSIELGLCLMALAKSLGRKELVQQAMSCFDRVLEEGHQDERVLSKLAGSCYELYLQTGWRHLARKSRGAFEKLFEKRAPSSLELERYAAVALLLAELEPEPSAWKQFFLYFNKPSYESLRLQLLYWHAQWLKAMQAERIDQIRILERELKAREELESDAHYWMLRGLCQFSQAHYFREQPELTRAIEYLQRALAIDSERPAAWHHLARAYLLHSELDPDSESAKRASQLFAMGLVCGRYSEQFWVDWGLAFLRVADLTSDRVALSEAMLRFEKALEMISREALPMNYKLLYFYGCALDFLGDMQHDEECYERAVQLLQTVVQAQPELEDATSALAVALTHMGEATSELQLLEQADQLFAYLSEQDQEDEYLWNEWGVCLLSLARLHREQAEEGEPSLSKAIYVLSRSLHLGNQHALYNLCCAYALKGESKRAVHYLKQALEAGIHPVLEDLLEDEWLESLHGYPAFEELIAALRQEEDQPQAPDLDEEAGSP